MHLPQDCPKQSSFAYAVIADEADPALGTDCPVDVVEKFFI